MLVMQSLKYHPNVQKWEKDIQKVKGNIKPLQTGLNVTTTACYAKLRLLISPILPYRKNQVP